MIKIQNNLILIVSILLVIVSCKKTINTGDQKDSPNNFWFQSGLDSTHIASMAISKTGVIFAGTVGPPSDIKLYRSTDNGGSWRLLNTPPIRGYITIIAISNNGIIFASYNNGMNGGLLYSKDNGGNWIESSLSPRSISCITFNSDDHVYVGSIKHDESGGGIVFSMDNGENWLNTKWNPLNSVDALLVTNQDNILAYSYNGLNKSTDNGKTWVEIFNDSFMLGCEDLKLKADSLLFLSTRRNGIYRSVNLGETWIPTDLTKLYSPTLLITDEGYIFVADEDYRNISKGLFYSTDNGLNWNIISYKLVGEPIELMCKSALGYLFLGTHHRGVLRFDLTIF